VRESDWEPAANAASGDIPSCALVRVTGVTAGVIQLGQPTTDSAAALGVAGPAVIPEGGSGQVTFANRAVVAYETADGTPAPGSVWGAAAGSWKLRSGKYGWLILGGAGAGRVNAVRLPVPTSSPTPSYDPTPDPTQETTDPRVIRTVYQMYDGKPTVLETRQNCVTSRNSSGQVLTIVCDPPTTSRQSIDPCLFASCCDDAALAVTISATPDHGTAPLTVAFSATVAGSHSYLWEFGDGGTSTSEDPSHTYTSAGLYVAVLTVDDCRQERVAVAVAPTDCSCAGCDPTEETSAPATRTLEFTGGTGEWADLNGVWTLYRTGGCLWQWFRDDWRVSQDYDGGHVQVTAVNDASGTQATWRNTAVAADCCDPANDMELVSRTPEVIGDDIPTFVPGDEVYTTDSCAPCTVTVGCGTVPGRLYFHTTSCACIGIGVDSVPVTYNASGADGAGWYSGGLLCTPDTLNVWFKCVDTGGGSFEWRAYQSCRSGTATGSVTGADLVTGAPVAIPTDGNCCSVSTTGTLKTTP
jgi:hypothetical protein